MSSFASADTESFSRLQNRYRAFAEHEAKGVSPLYEELARAVAESETALRFLCALPTPKQQPNLLFAAVRHLFGVPKDQYEFLRLIEDNPDPIRDVILTRGTQTNEPARCAVLLPLLARLPQPLALVEVGASAGLCLLTDYYGYDYGRARLDPAHAVGGVHPPVFPCLANEATPIPSQIPRIAWRAGLDLNPLDVSDPDERAWLQTLVWPGQEERAERLEAALELARHVPVPIERGDLLTDLSALVVAAPKEATLVIFHSAVLAYVAPEDRDRFTRQVTDLGAVWISNESAGVLPWIAEKLRQQAPADRFLLSLNGEPVALTGPHGQSIEWLG